MTIALAVAAALYLLWGEVSYRQGKRHGREQGRIEGETAALQRELDGLRAWLGEHAKKTDEQKPH